MLVIKSSEYRLIITWVTEALLCFHETFIIQGKQIAQIIKKQVTILHITKPVRNDNQI